MSSQRISPRREDARIASAAVRADAVGVEAAVDLRAAAPRGLLARLRGLDRRVEDPRRWQRAQLVDVAAPRPDLPGHGRYGRREAAAVDHVVRLVARRGLAHLDLAA